jgi:transposase
VPSVPEILSFPVKFGTVHADIIGMKGRRKRKARKERKCPNCARLEQEYSRRVAELEKALEMALKRIAELEELLGLNSRNSSRPPSSDPPSAPPRPSQTPTGRKRGGQPGHKGQRRDLLPEEEVDQLFTYVPTSCAHCHRPLPVKPGPGDPPPCRHQVFELPEKLYEVTEHQAHARRCPTCGHLNRAELPSEVARSGSGPRLAAAISMLTGHLNVSRRDGQEFVQDVLGIPIALGTVSNLEAEMTDALADIHEEAGENVQQSGLKNIDETGWKLRSKKCWLWTAATSVVAFFIIHRSRGREALKKLVGEKLRGIFTSDRWGAYNVRGTRFRQICWSHLLRDFQRLVDRGGKEARIGKRAKDIGDYVFMVWKDFKTGGIDAETLRRCLRPLRTQLREVLQDGSRLANCKGATFCQNLLDLEPAIWTFARHAEAGVEPTNNHAERVLRKGVLWRKRSFGADSERGCRFVERMLTVVQSRRLQRQRVFSFLVEALNAHRSGNQPPSLIPACS